MSIAPARQHGGVPSVQTFAGKRVAVHALADGYALRLAPALQREAEALVERLERLLHPPDERREDRIDIYLADPVALSPEVGGAENAPVPGAIVRVAQPDAPDEPLAEQLTRALTGRWFGPSAQDVTWLLRGVAGLAAGTRRPEGDRLPAEVAAGQGVSVISGDPSVSDAAASSFVAFLRDLGGPAALGTFLAAYDPGRRDQAALRAFQRPLGALEEAWLASLRHQGGGTFRAFFGYLLPLLRPYWRRELEVLVYMLFGVSYGLVLPLSWKYLLDTVIPSGSLGRLGLFVLVLLIIYVLNMVIATRRAYVNNWVNQRLLIALQERMFGRLQRLSHRFYGEAKVGDIMARFTSDVMIVQQAMAQVAGVGVSLAMSAVAATITLLILSPLLGVLVLAVVPLFVVGYILLGSRLEAASHDRQQRTGEAMAVLQENLSAYAVIRAFSLEERAIAVYHAVMDGLFAAMLRLVIYGALFEASTALATTLGQLVVLGVGGALVIKGHLTVGSLLAFIGLLPSLFQPVGALSGIGQTVQAAAGSLERIDDLLEEPVEVADAPDAAVLPPLSREIRLDGVSFDYGDGKPVLSDLDLTIAAGTHTAIVGPSGSGKSTIVNLLLRFWDPERGAVRFDGHDLRAVTLTSLRGQIGLVFQDTFIFDTSARENIALARPGASDAAVVDAARAARLDEYIASLPDGYDTILGERGVRMSGGQRQRLAIARALLRDPRVLILDEATSALDARTEREILETLAEVARGRTAVSITHRLSLAAMADRIVVLDGGRIIEQGTHDELSRAGGLYQSLYEEQVGHLTGAIRADTGVERGRAVIAERMRAIPLFSGLIDEALEVLAGQISLERYAAGETIVRQGEPGDTLYFISRGEVEVVRTAGSVERRLNTLTAGDYFGEMALLSDEPRTATVRTTAPTHLYSLAREDFEALLAREPAIRRAVEEGIAGRRAAFAAVLVAS